jgi:hypothetical protein
LTSALDEAEWSALLLGRFTPVFFFIGAWVNARARLGKRNNLASAGSRTPEVQPLARRCTDQDIPTLNQNIMVKNRTSENVAGLKYLGMTVTNQSLVHEEIK